MSAKQIQAKIAKLNERIKARSGELTKLRDEKKKLQGDLATARATEKAKPKAKKKPAAKKAAPAAPPATS
ncbi:MAG: hypothetical protein HYS12_12325 [Planctomycetes bacterium]|nr:hypothetical protein [Planctomycetota bacterium]